MYELAPFALPAGYGDIVLPLADAKAYLSIEESETEFDDLIAALRDAAVQMTELYSGVILAPREGMVWIAESRPSRLRLGVTPVTAVTGFDYLDGDGVAGEVDVATLRLGLNSEVLLKAGESWPSGIRSGLEVTFNAGHDDDTRPAVLVLAAKMFLAHLFRNREAVITGTISGEIPFGFRQLCAPYRPVI